MDISQIMRPKKFVTPIISVPPKDATEFTCSRDVAFCYDWNLAVLSSGTICKLESACCSR